MTAQPNEEREMLMDANGRMLRRCPECRKEHGGTKKREWWTGEEYWEEGVSAGGDEGLNVPIMPNKKIPIVYNSSIPLNHAY